MPLGLVKKILGEDAQTNGRKQQHIDLTEWDGGSPHRDADTVVQVAELSRYEDLKGFTSLVYDGNILVVDIGPIQDNDMVLKRVTNDLKNVAEDVGGDVAGIGRNLLVVTPGGVQVGRKKLHGTDTG